MRRFIIIAAWIILLAFLVYVFFFKPEIFNHIFEYPGPGSPYVNTPQG
jgi:hypothetical protein